MWASWNNEMVWSNEKNTILSECVCVNEIDVRIGLNYVRFMIITLVRVCVCVKLNAKTHNANTRGSHKRKRLKMLEAEATDCV